MGMKKGEPVSFIVIPVVLFNSQSKYALVRYDLKTDPTQNPQMRISVQRVYLAIQILSRKVDISNSSSPARPWSERQPWTALANFPVSTHPVEEDKASIIFGLSSMWEPLTMMETNGAMLDHQQPRAFDCASHQGSSELTQLTL